MYIIMSMIAVVFIVLFSNYIGDTVPFWGIMLLFWVSRITFRNMFEEGK